MHDTEEICSRLAADELQELAGALGEMDDVVVRIDEHRRGRPMLEELEMDFRQRSTVHARQCGPWNAEGGILHKAAAMNDGTGIRAVVRLDDTDQGTGARGH